MLEKLRREALLLSALAGLLLWVAAVSVAAVLDLGSAYAIKVLFVFGAALAWLGLYLPEHLPHAHTGPANQVTLARLALTAMLGGLLGESAPLLAWHAFALAGLILVLDGVDGWLARRGGWCSRFGARFDMETDALLILLMAALVWQLDKAGAWVLLAGAIRYGFVAAGFVLAWLRRPLPDSQRRKTVCVVQVLTLLAALAPAVPAPLSGAVAATGLGLLAWSFLADVVWLRNVADQPLQGDDTR